MSKDEDIVYIDKNTRKRNGKLERKDPVTGVWVIHPMQFYEDNRMAMEDMHQEIDEEDRKERDRMFEPENAELFLKDAVSKYDRKAKKVDVQKVYDVQLKGGFSKENKLELIFDGILKNKHSRFIAGCWSYSGDFYEPPSEECWFQDYYDTLNYEEKKLEEILKPERGYNKETKNLVPLKEATPEQIQAEKQRLKKIYDKRIERLNYLKKFKDL